MADNIKKTINRNEQRYNDFVQSCAENIACDSSVKLLLVAGPSCSGKTTTTEKLVSHLEAFGKKAHMISIDDFYKNSEDLPVNPDGTKNMESFDSIDTASLHECLADLAKGREAEVPLFDFTISRRNGVRKKIKLSKDDIAIIEGLHALNPDIYRNFVSEDMVYKIFLDCHSESVSEMRYSRLIRRLVRDFYYRSSDAANTFFLWKGVLEGEKKYIYPYAHLADTTINTYFEYETRVFKSHVMPILEATPTDSEYRPSAEAILEFLSGIDGIDSKYVPKDSLLQEFLK